MKNSHQNKHAFYPTVVVVFSLFLITGTNCDSNLNKKTTNFEVNSIKNKPTINSPVSPFYEITKTIDYWYFDLLIIKDKKDEEQLIYEPVYYLAIHLKNDDKIRVMFEMDDILKNEKLEQISDDYYLRYWYTGGNSPHSEQYNLIKITLDTAFYLGNVSGYGYINDDNRKELYIHFIDYYRNDANASYVLGYIPLKLKNDSLVYPPIYKNMYASHPDNSNFLLQPQTIL